MDGGSSCPLFQVELEFGMLVLAGGGGEGEGEGEETRGPGEKPLEQGWEPTTNLTHMWYQVLESNPGHSGGRQVLSLLHNPF